MNRNAWMTGMDERDRMFFLHGEYTGVMLQEPLRRKPLSPLTRAYLVIAALIMVGCGLWGLTWAG